MTYMIIDSITGAITTNFSVSLKESIRSLFTYDPVEILPDDITEAIDALAEKAESGDYYGDEEAFLGVEVTPC